MSAPNIETSNSTANIGGDTNGVKLGIKTTETLGFYGSAGITQYTAAAVTTGFTAGSGTTATSASTYTGNIGSTAYTVGDIVAVLKSLGLIAQ